jgi:hypothetical protein
MNKMPTFTWSSFQRDPTSVDAALQQHGRVALKRREGKLVFLVNEDEHQGETTAVEALTAFLAASPATSIFEGAWPWLALFSPASQQHFITDYMRTARACLSLQEMRPLHVLVQQWKNTASAIAAGIDLTTPLNPDGSVQQTVKRPGSAQRRTASAKAQ